MVIISLVMALLVSVTGCGGSSTGAPVASSTSGIKIDKPTTITFFGMRFGATEAMGKQNGKGC